MSRYREESAMISSCVFIRRSSASQDSRPAIIRMAHRTPLAINAV